MKLKLIIPTDPNAPPCSSCGKPARLQIRLEHKDDFILLCGVCAWALVGDMPTEAIDHITPRETATGAPNKYPQGLKSRKKRK